MFVKSTNEKMVFQGSFIDVSKALLISILLFGFSILATFVSFVAGNENDLPFFAAFFDIPVMAVFGILTCLAFVFVWLFFSMWILIHCSEVIVTNRRIYIKRFLLAESIVPIEKITMYGSRWGFVFPDIFVMRAPSVHLRLGLLRSRSLNTLLTVLLQLTNSPDLVTDDPDNTLPQND